MNKTKQRAAGLALCLLLGLLTACGGAAESASPAAGESATPSTENSAAAEIEISYWEGSTSDKEAFDAVFAQFEQDHPEISLVKQVYPSNTYLDQLDTRIAANDWPDVIRYTYQRLGKFKEADVMLDLSDRIPEENLADLLPAYREALTHDGKLVGMPHHTDTMAVYYNKRMFEASGIRIPQSPDDAWSWEELDEIARKLKSEHSLSYAFGGMWENGSGYRYLPFVYMAGGAILSEDMTSVAINSPQTLEAVKLYENWRRDDLVLKTGFTQEPQANMLFVAEQVAFVFAGSWHCSYMEDNMPGNWGVTYIPQKDGRTGSDMGGNSLFAYAGTDQPDAAATLIETLTGKEYMKLLCETGNFIPVRSSLISEGLAFSAYPEEMAKFLEITETIDPKMAADETSVRFQQLNVIFSEAMDPLAIDGSVTAEQVIETCESRMAEALAE